MILKCFVFDETIFQLLFNQVYSQDGTVSDSCNYNFYDHIYVTVLLRMDNFPFVSCCNFPFFINEEGKKKTTNARDKFTKNIFF